MKTILTALKKTTVKPRKVMYLQICLPSTHVQLLESQTAFYSPICRLPVPNFMVCARAFATRFGALLLPCFWWHAYSMLVATKWMELKKVTLEKKSSDSPEHPTLRNEL